MPIDSAGARDGEDAVENEIVQSRPSPSELPFLVTHWLSNYQIPRPSGDDQVDRRQEEALERLRQAASQVSSAFADLGSFGVSNVPNFQRQLHSINSNRLPLTRNTTYADMRRQWHNVAPQHLERVLRAAASSTTAAETSVQNNLPGEDVFQTVREIVPDLRGGRKLGNAVVDLTREQTPVDDSNSRVTSVLQAPSFWTNPPRPGKEKPGYADKKDTNDDSNDYKTIVVPLESDYRRTMESSGIAMRNFLTTREEFLSQKEDLQCAQESIRRQQTKLQELAAQREKTMEQSKNETLHLLPGQTQAAAAVFRLNEIKESELNCDRVVAQLTNRIAQISDATKNTEKELKKAKSEAHRLYRKTTTVLRLQHDPTQLLFQRSTLAGSRLEVSMNTNNVLLNTVARCHLGGPCANHLGHRRFGRAPSARGVIQIRKSLLAGRLSHAVTINAHLAFPIYCLRFDRTGRYFVTGADDCLVKLFYLGAARSPVARPTSIIGSPHRLKFSYGANERGAVLVCTLRGHAGVICDIDVSSDNSFLATASDDGDVRVWGLKDGCPVAILRAHAGGANMVSWSSLTPYRLVTTGMDGMARIWDIREAALKRYGVVIGKRLDYTLPLTESEKENGTGCQKSSEADTLEPAALPPLPVREQQAQGQENQPVADPAAAVALPVAPGAPAAGGDQIQQEVNNLNANIAAGIFVFNDTIDEGVSVVAKLQHGEAQESNSGPGTRARRKTVKVICVARSPQGRQFATGSDDGLCRVWEDEGDWRVQTLDARFSQTKKSPVNRKRAPNSSASSRLLTTLYGHMSSITDLHYSHRGDRLLTASQKDGNARIWSIGQRRGGDKQPFHHDVKQIVLRLSSMSKPAPAAASGRKKRAAGTSSTNTNLTCDVAVWTADDSKIVTSQASPVKASGQEIVPGSQLVLVWDSWTGQCLVGIPNAHAMQCPVIVPHPKLPGIICSAGGDGLAKVWDLEAGKCLFTHENKIDSGPIAPQNDKTKLSGYLDGAFDPEGLFLVLTDDNGRVTLLESALRADNCVQWSAPSWMKEQYFGNDYYELFYNSNGYCVERGSEQPPHLAPRAVRCSHSGSPWSQEISETFLYLNGPPPLPEAVVRTQRLAISTQVNKSVGSVADKSSQRTIVMSECDPSQMVIIGQRSLQTQPPPGVESFFAQSEGTTRPSQTPNQPPPNARRGQTGASLSANFRWRDYEDLMRDEPLNDGAEADADDEEFVPQRAPPPDEELSDVVVSDASIDSDDSQANTRSQSARSQRMRRRRRERDQLVADEDERTSAQPRTSSRRLATARRAYDFSDDDDDDDDLEFMSTNNVPSGPYLSDYNEAGHLFRLPDSGRVNRKWVTRLESASSYKGTKDYTPQAGDTVVYIPRAHSQLIRAFPTLKPTWRTWPSGSMWPVVRCRILDVRYRFPYKDYYRTRSAQKCSSIVAVLTLDVVGITELSNDRQFPWPKPSFIDRQSRPRIVFEVSLFESDTEVYIIPEALYLWRLRCLEGAASNYSTVGLRVVSYYVAHPETAGEDSDMTGYTARVVAQEAEERVLSDDHHTWDSGFNSLKIEWDDGDDGEAAFTSPWEIVLGEKAFDTPKAPALTNMEKKCVASVIQSTLQSLSVKEYFGQPVDTSKYSDYLRRIEVPMDFDVIKRRLEADYYSNTLSVVSDVKTMRDNCVKYNGVGNELSIFADEMCSTFLENLKRELASKGEPADIELYEKRSDAEQTSAATNETQGDPPRNLRSNARRPSSLELLPASEVAPQENGRAGTRAEGGDEPDLGRSSNRRIQESDSETSDSAQDRSSNGGSESERYETELSEDEEMEDAERPRRGRRQTQTTPVDSPHSDSDDHGSNGRRLRSSGRGVAGNSNARAGRKRPAHSDESSFATPEESSESSSLDSGSETHVRRGRPTRSNRTGRRNDVKRRARGNGNAGNRRSGRGSNRTARRQRQPHLDDSEESDESESDGLESEPEERNVPARRRGVRSRAGWAGNELVSEDTKPRRATRSASRKEETDEDSFEDEDSSEESDDFVGNSRTRGGRGVSTTRPNAAGSRRAARQQVDDASDDFDESDESDESDTRKKNTPPLITESPRRSSRQRNVVARHDPVPTNRAPRRNGSEPSRASRRLASAHEDVDSQNARRASSRLRHVPRTTLADVDSDFDEEAAEAPKPRTASKKRQAPGGRGLERKRAKRSSAVSNPIVVEDLEKWPEIKRDEIEEVGHYVLDRLEELDDMGDFKGPVVENVPELATAYLAAIAEPMDLATIRESRLPDYKRIGELQADLRLVFNNCVVFNKNNAYAKKAKFLWGMVNDIFVDACHEVGTRIPRSWSNRR